MVALCVDTVVACDAASSLAVVRFEIKRRRFVEAGRALRRALQQYLRAECRYYRCLPGRRTSSAALADALQRAGVFSALAHTWMGEIADVAADAIAGRLVPLSKFDEALRTLEALLDACPYLVAEKGGRA